MTRALTLALACVSLSGAVHAALKPVEAELHPAGKKAVLPYKATPQGDLKVNLYFPPKWKAADRRPAILFFFGGSCATGNAAQFEATAEYFAARGMVAA